MTEILKRITTEREVDRRFVPAATGAGDPTSVTFVLCIEAGKMENMALRLVTSLRRWGGRMALNEVLAVNPRRGVAISSAARQRLETLGARLIVRPSANPVPWFPIYNKAAAVQIADHEANGEWVRLLASEPVVLGGPELCALPTGCAFRAGPLSRSCASRGADDPNEPFWRIVSAAVGTNLATMEWVRDFFEGEPMRMYFNSGVFAFRRGMRFGDEYAADFLKVLYCGFRSPTSGIYNTSQVTLPLTVHRLGLRAECLPISHHTPIVGNVVREQCEAALPTSKLVHYFRSLTADQFGRFASLFNETHPEVGQWLLKLGPIEARQRPISRMIGKTLYEWRRLRYRAFEKKSAIASTASSAL